MIHPKYFMGSTLMSMLATLSRSIPSSELTMLPLKRLTTQSVMVDTKESRIPSPVTSMWMSLEQ